MSLLSCCLNHSVKQISFACLLAAAAFFSAHDAIASPQAGNENVSEATKLPLEGETLVVAFSVVPPFVSLSESLTSPIGVDIEIIKELQRRTGFALRNDKIEVMNFNEMMDLGRNQKIDIIGGSISYSESRAKEFDVTKPYLNATVSLVTTKDSNIADLKDLANRTVAVQRGTNMSELLKGVQNVKFYEVPTTFMAFYAVSRGHADAMFIDTPVARNYAHKWENGKLKLVKEIPGSQSAVCFLLKKGSPHNEALLNAFEQMRADGTLKRIEDKYLFSN